MLALCFYVFYVGLQATVRARVLYTYATRLPPRVYTKYDKSSDVIVPAVDVHLCSVNV